MNQTRWDFDVKSLIIGFLLATVAAFIFNGTPASRAANGDGIAADESGVYIMSGGSVRYIEKQKCRLPNGGCHINTQ